MTGTQDRYRNEPVSTIERAREKVVTMTAFRRPDYTWQVLDALSRCAGVDEYRVLIHVDPGSPQVVQVIKQARLPRKCLVQNADRLGCNLNTYSALHHGFQCADFVIHLEDDTVPAADCLKYFEWARDAYRDDQRVFSVSSYSKSVGRTDDGHRVVREPWFTPWGWATWADRWNEMHANWSHGATSWDIALNRLRGDRVAIRPVLARVQNIGAHLGEHVPGPEYHRANHFNEYGVWSVRVNDSALFHET